MKNKIIAGNWKMNKTKAEAEAFFNELLPLVKNTENTVVLCVPFTCLCKACKLTAKSNVQIGAQNCHWAQNGAFTGEISPEMICDVGATYVIVGHSERRSMFGETDETVNMRAKNALSSGLKTIICVGETLEERQKGNTVDVLRRQTEKALAGITDLQNVIIAYEPVWAIGTGVTATVGEAGATIEEIRKVVAGLYGKNTAQNLYVLYGGSMNEHNADELLSDSRIDGGLIGGASLSAGKFASIANYKSK